MTKPSIKIDFLQDLREHYKFLLQGIGYNLPAEATVSDACTLYNNYLHRKLVPSQRQVKWSRELSRKTLNTDILAGCEAFSKASEAGHDLTPFMTTTIQDPEISDTLLNDWAIYHFHLYVDRMEPSGFVGRGSELLFAFVTNQNVYLIDILDHNSFCDTDLFEIIHQNWPDIIRKFRPPGVSNATNLNEDGDEIKIRKTLRKAGLQTIIVTHDKTVYLPFGDGFMSGTLGFIQDRILAQPNKDEKKILREITVRGKLSFLVARISDDICNRIVQLERKCQERAEILHQKIREQFGHELTCLDIKLHLDGDCLSIEEMASGYLIFREERSYKHGPAI